MNSSVREFDVAVLKIGDKKFIGSLFTVLSMCDDFNITKRNGRVEDFRLNVPRADYPTSPFRIKFVLIRHLYTSRYHYYHYRAHVESKGVLETKLLAHLSNDRTLKRLREPREITYYWP